MFFSTLSVWVSITEINVSSTFATYKKDLSGVKNSASGPLPTNTTEELVLFSRALLSIMVVMTVFYTNAQSFTLSWDGEVYADTISIYPDTAGAQTLTLHAIFNNETDKDASIRMVREEISMFGDTYSDFCWGGQCWPPQTDTSGLQLVPAGSSSGELDFSAYYHAENTIGVSVIKYTFYNEHLPEERVSVVVWYDTNPDGIDESIFNQINVSEIYPNPAISNVSLDYNIPHEVETANVKIINILGSVVKEQQINTGKGKVSMNISELNSGIYFYSLFVNGEVFKTKKLIVR